MMGCALIRSASGKPGRADVAKPVKEIPADMTKGDATGKKTHERSSWKMLPPPKDCCQICGVRHEPEQPHNQQSLYYQTAFHGMIGRMPTWADALAHCSDAIRTAWMEELKKMGHWSEPPDGEAPVAHHGLDGAP